MALPPNTNTASTQPTSNVAANSKKNQTKGTGFTNINSILDANQGAGQKMGEKIGGGLTQQANSVRAGIESGQNQFNAQKNQAGTAAKGAVQAGQNLTKQAGETDQAYQSRLAQPQQPQDFSAIGNNLRSAEYTGPMGLQNAGQIQAQAANAQTAGRQAGTTEGQQQLLKQMVAKPGNYTAGQSALDTMLLGQGGQGAIQQGRRDTLGVQNKAQGAIDLAGNQANALKGGIAQSRDKALADLRTNLSGQGGITEQAAANAQKFQADATKLQSLMAGTWNPSTPEEKAEAEALLGTMGDYGVDSGYNLYNQNSDQAQNALSQFAGTLAQDFGSKYYKGDSKMAGQNLADVLADKGLKDEIKNSNFNTDVFGNESDSFRALDDDRTFDTETRSILNNLSGDVRAASANNEVLKQQTNDLANNGVDYEALGWAMPTQEQTNNYYQYAGPQSDNRKVADGYSQYGFLGFGDHGEQDIAERFRGLGLNKEHEMSGVYRSADQVDQAAAKAVGPDEQLRQFILKRMAAGN